MAEKTNFVHGIDQSTNDDTRPLPEKCCGRCAHARKQIDKGMLKPAYVCKAGPPTPVIIQVQTRAGVQVGQQGRYPVMDARDECDTFAPGGPIDETGAAPKPS